MKTKNSYLHDGVIYSFEEVLKYFDLCISKNSGIVSMHYNPSASVKSITIYTASSVYVFKEL